jgi:hypothetical protein
MTNKNENKALSQSMFKKVSSDDKNKFLNNKFLCFAEKCTQMTLILLVYGGKMLF